MSRCAHPEHTSSAWPGAMKQKRPATRAGVGVSATALRHANHHTHGCGQHRGLARSNPRRDAPLRRPLPTCVKCPAELCLGSGGLPCCSSFSKKAFPVTHPTSPRCRPGGFLAFVWACARGVRGYVVAMARAVGADSAVYEALLFAVLRPRGSSWIATSHTRRPGARAAIRSPGWLRSWWPALRWWRCAPASSTRRWPSICPLRLRWNFHRLMLGRS